MFVFTWTDGIILLASYVEAGVNYKVHESEVTFVEQTLT